jgi:hypothetical protein
VAHGHPYGIAMSVTPANAGGQGMLRGLTTLGETPPGLWIPAFAGMTAAHLPVGARLMSHPYGPRESMGGPMGRPNIYFFRNSTYDVRA